MASRALVPCPSRPPRVVLAGRRRPALRAIASHNHELATKDGGGNKVRLSFKIPYRVHYGQDVAMVGSTELLGNWDPRRAMGMRWSEGDMWHVDFEVAAGPNTEMEYKYVVRNPDGNAHVWKPGSNCHLSLASLAPVLATASRANMALGGVAVRDAWDGAIRDVRVEVRERGGAAAGGGAGGARPPVSEAMRETSASLAAALDELASQIVHAEAVSSQHTDPAAPELLQVDRSVAAASRKATAAVHALEAARAAAGRLTAAAGF